MKLSTPSEHPLIQALKLISLGLFAPEKMAPASLVMSAYRDREVT